MLQLKLRFRCCTSQLVILHPHGLELPLLLQTKKHLCRSLETTNFHVAVTLKEDRCTRFHSFFCSVQRNWHVHCLLRRLSTGISLHAATIEGATILYQSMLHSTRSYNKNYCFLSSRGILPQLPKSHATINIYAQCTWAQHLVITPGSPTSILERLHCD